MARTVKKEKALKPEEKLSQALVPDMEQPYRVPDNWCWVSLSSLVSLYNGDRGVNYPSKKDYVETGIPFINAGAIQDGRLDPLEYNYITQGKYDALRAGKVQIDDILYCLRGSLGKTAIVDFESQGAISSSLCILRARTGISVKYLYYLLSSDTIVKQQGFAENGSAQPNLSAASVLQYKVPLAPFAEQQRIVDRIESLFAKLNEAKEKAQAVIDGYEDRRAAILHKAFTGELTEEWRRNNGISRDTWNNCTIGDIFIHTTGKALKKSNTNGSLHKYITTSNLYWGRFDFSEVREMYFTDDELDKCTVQKGDLLICNGGDVGRAAIWNYDYDICIQNHISKLRKKQNNIDVVFCYYFFMLSKIKGKINGKGIGIASLSAKDLLAMPIDVPSIEEQHEISSILDELFNNEQQAKETAEQVIDQIDAMKKSIFARAFRGELGTSNPTDEPATDLLRKILEQSN